MKRWSFLLAAAVPIVATVVIFLRSRSTHAHPDELVQLIDRADKLVVLQRPGDGSPVLFESSERRDLDALKASLRLERPRPNEVTYCGCAGSPAIILYANGQKIGEITNHHAMLIRCSIWKTDVRLMDVEAFLQWFDERKIHGPRQEYEASLARDKEYQDYQRKWVEGMPDSLKPLWPATKLNFQPDLTPLRDALAEQIPDKNARILALFSWYGSGAGPWSGYPTYEGHAEGMLLEYPTAELLAAVNSRELTETQIEGVARLFGGWAFSQQRPNDRLPADLKGRLLKHGLASKNEDNRARARRAFDEK